LHKECPEKENTTSTPVCCNCQLVEGEKPHPANYRRCRHAEELQRKKLQKTLKPITGRVFSSNPVSPDVSFAAALLGSTSQEQRPLKVGAHLPSPDGRHGPDRNFLCDCAHQIRSIRISDGGRGEIPKTLSAPYGLIGLTAPLGNTRRHCRTPICTMRTSERRLI
jgi:hypothetical protein